MQTKDVLAGWYSKIEDDERAKDIINKQIKG